MQTLTLRNRHERRKQVAEARRLGRQDLLRQPSATVERSEMQATLPYEQWLPVFLTLPKGQRLQALVERDWALHAEAHQRLLETPMLVNTTDHANLQRLLPST